MLDTYHTQHVNISKSLGKSSSSLILSFWFNWHRKHIVLYAEGNASTERTVHITQCHKPSETPETTAEVPEKFKMGLFWSAQILGESRVARKAIYYFLLLPTLRDLGMQILYASSIRLVNTRGESIFFTAIHLSGTIEIVQIWMPGGEQKLLCHMFDNKHYR